MRPMTTTQVTAQVGSDAKALDEKVIRELAVELRLSAAQVTAQVAKVLGAATGGGGSREQLQAAASMKHREHFRKAYVEGTAGTVDGASAGEKQGA